MRSTLTSSRWRVFQVFAMASAMLALIVAALAPNGSASAATITTTTKLNKAPISSSATVDPQIAKISGKVSVMLELSGVPAAVAFAASNTSSNSKSPSASAVTAGVNQANANEAEQTSVLRSIQSANTGATVVERVKLAYNGISVIVDASQIAKLAAIRGVTAIHLNKEVKLDNFSSVPLIGAPTAWESYGLTGQGINIGIIDTGIDYRHTNFAGPGTYTGCDTTVTNEAGCTFPTSKVVGGYDFVGDTYNADPTSAAFQPVPQPDPDPMDCNGHGSHVAGTAAGYGVNADGSTYTGDYSNSTPFDSLRIGPGVAPEAHLWALRIFGCDGSSNGDVIARAIDYALDPNGDGNMVDHLDVVNMSLGADYQSDKNDVDATASNNAALAGLVVAAAAGNAGDINYVAGSPGNATRVIGVAASTDAGAVVDGFRVNSPSAIAGVYEATESALYNWANPPVTHTVPVTANIYYPSDIAAASGRSIQYGCDAYPAAEAAKIAGTIVLVDWTKPGDATFPCGSVARANNAQNAGAVGIIMADSVNDFNTSINGNANIPAMYSTKHAGDILKSQLTAGTPSNVSVTLSHEYHSTVKANDPTIVDKIASFSSRGPRIYDSALKPDISAPGVTIFSTAAGTGNQGLTENGTSMATPHIAGVMALLKEAHPTWTVEELKALVMNNADKDIFSGPSQTGDKFSPQRQGAGRVDVPNALNATDVVAFGVDDPGAVSVSFGAVQVLDTYTATKTIRVENKSETDMTYSVAYDSRSAIPGVEYTFPEGSSVFVPAGTSVTFPVELTITAADMLNTHDPTIETESGREFLAEASGLIELTREVPTGDLKAAGAPVTALRVPVYVTARPASDMHAAVSSLAVSGATANVTIPLTGTGIFEGGDVPTDTISLVSAFELQGDSSEITPVNNQRLSDADLHYIGVSNDGIGRVAAGKTITSTEIFFGISTWGQWSIPTGQDAEFDIYIDTNMDGTDDFVLYNTRVAGTDTLVSTLVNLHTGAAAAQDLINWFGQSTDPNVGGVSTAVFNNSVMEMSVYAANLGLNPASGSARFSYHIATFSQSAPIDDIGYTAQVDAAGPFTYDFVNPGVSFGGSSSLTKNLFGISYGVPTFLDLPGESIDVAFNQANFFANESLGVLLLHHFNLFGAREDVLPLSGAAATVTATSTATAIPTETAVPACSPSFNDVTSTDYFDTAVKYLYCDGAISGYSDNTFRPYNTATRAQLVKIVVVAEGFEITTPTTPTFSDVPASDPFYGYIETAVAKGIISGYGSTFSPEKNVTRAQIAKIVTLAEGWTLVNPATPSFTDVPTTDTFYKYIETAYAHYVISGYSCSSPAPCPGAYFNPGANALRGQIAKIVYLAVTGQGTR